MRNIVIWDDCLLSLLGYIRPTRLKVMLKYMMRALQFVRMDFRMRTLLVLSLQYKNLPISG